MHNTAVDANGHHPGTTWNSFINTTTNGIRRVYIYLNTIRISWSGRLHERTIQMLWYFRLGNGRKWSNRIWLFPGRSRIYSVEPVYVFKMHDSVFTSGNDKIPFKCLVVLFKGSQRLHYDPSHKDLSSVYSFGGPKSSGWAVVGLR